MAVPPPFRSRTPGGLPRSPTHPRQPQPQPYPARPAADQPHPTPTPPRVADDWGARSAAAAPNYSAPTTGSRTPTPRTRTHTRARASAYHLLVTDATMGRLHSKGKGISQSSIPYRRSAPSWCKTSDQECVDLIAKLAKRGLTPSQIGVQLRDQHGVGLSKPITGNKIVRILRAQGLAPALPEDLYFLVKKAVSVRKHLERNRQDKDAKFRLILVESRIHRLARYYRRTGALPPTWKYESATAAQLVS